MEFNDPRFSLGAHLLANSGYSRAPQGLSGIGQAITQWQGQQAELQNQALRQKIAEKQGQKIDSELKMAEQQFQQEQRRIKMLEGLAAQEGKRFSLANPSPSPEQRAGLTRMQLAASSGDVKGIGEAYKMMYKGQSPYGNSMTGRMYEIIDQVEAMRQQGQPVPPDMQRQYTIAQHDLNKPRMVQSPEGTMYSYTPGVPRFGQTSRASDQTSGASNMKEVFPSQNALNKQNALRTMNEVLDILDAAEAKGEEVTGVTGAAKRLFAPIARQGGYEISPMAENLQRKLQILQGVMGPLILNEKRLSESERERLNQIIGSVDWRTDQTSLREMLKEMAGFLGEQNGK